TLFGATGESFEQLAIRTPAIMAIPARGRRVKHFPNMLRITDLRVQGGLLTTPSTTTAASDDSLLRQTVNRARRTRALSWNIPPEAKMCRTVYAQGGVESKAVGGPGIALMLSAKMSGA